MKSRRLFVMASVLLTAALAATSLILGAVPANADATIVYDLIKNPSFVSPNSKCEADVAIIGSRGSDQPLLDKDADPEGRDEGKPVQQGARPQDQVLGFGNEVATAAYEITRRLPPETNVRLIPIDYPAVEAMNGFVQEVEIDLPVIAPFEAMVLGLSNTYKTSVERGVEITVDTVRNLSKVCSETKIVLIGFSQGAQVMHWALDSLKQEGLLGAVAAVQLIADPTRDRNDQVPHNYTGKGALSSDHFWQDPYKNVPGVIEQETHLRGRGFLRAGTWLTQYDYVPIPAELSGKVVNVCHSLDHVCDFSTKNDFGAHGGAYQNIFKPGDVHIQNSDIYTVPGAWMLDRLNLKRPERNGGSIGGTKCADVTVIGARGEDWLEFPDMAKFGPEIPGFGPSVSVATRELERQLPEGTNVAHANVLPAVGPAEAGAPMHGFISAGGDPFDFGVVDGVKRANELIAKSLTDCPRTKLVMIGYSQGAQILHEAVAASNQVVQDRTAAVWLMGDTARDPRINHGQVVGAGEMMPASDSGGQYVNEAAARGVVKLPDALQDRVHSVCMVKDKGCRNANGSDNGPTDRQTQREIYLDSKTVEAGAGWVLKRVASLPVITKAQIKEQIGENVGMAHEWWKYQGTGYNIRRPLSANRD
jgi:hypothetical protein